MATRYDKRERIYQGTIDVASISIWLRDPSPDPWDYALSRLPDDASTHRCLGRASKAVDQV